VAVSARDAALQAVEQLRLEHGAGGGQAEHSLSAIARTDGLAHQPTVLQIAKDPAERLFRNVEQLEQIADRHSRPTGDKVKCTVMGPAQSLRTEMDVGPFDHVAIAKIK